MKNHVTHILALAQPPLVHQRGGHRPELIERKIAESFQQFLPGHVPRTAAVFFRNPLEREIQRLLQEKIRLGVETLLALEDMEYRLLELHRVHGCSMCHANARVKALHESAKMPGFPVVDPPGGGC